MHYDKGTRAWAFIYFFVSLFVTYKYAINTRSRYWRGAYIYNKQYFSILASALGAKSNSFLSASSVYHMRVRKPTCIARPPAFCLFVRSKWSYNFCNLLFASFEWSLHICDVQKGSNYNDAKVYTLIKRFIVGGDYYSVCYYQPLWMFIYK